MQLAWSRIWTRVAVSISFDNNHYTTGTSTNQFIIGPHCVVSDKFGSLSYLHDASGILFLQMANNTTLSEEDFFLLDFFSSSFTRR